MTVKQIDQFNQGFFDERPFIGDKPCFGAPRSLDCGGKPRLQGGNAFVFIDTDARAIAYADQTDYQFLIHRAVP